MKKNVILPQAISLARNTSTIHLLATYALAFALIAPENTNASPQEHVLTRRTADLSDERSTKVFPLANAKIPTLNLTQAVNLGIPLGVLIRPDAPIPISEKSESAENVDHPINNSKR